MEMEYRTIDLTLVSANGLKNANLFGKMDVWATCTSLIVNFKKLTTPVIKGGGTKSTWNFRKKITVNEATAMQETFIFKIKAVGFFVYTELRQVHVPVKLLMEGVNNNTTTQGKSMQFLSFPVIRKRSKKPKGHVTFFYKIGGKFTRKPAATTSSNDSSQQPVAQQPTKK